MQKIKKIFHEVWLQMQDAELRLVAGSLAFSTVLSMIPFMALTLAVFHFLGGLEYLEPRLQHILLQYLHQALGEEATVFVKEALVNFHLKAVGFTAVVFLFYTSMRLLQDIEKGISRMWEKKKRPLLRRIFIAWFLLVTFTLSMAVYTGFRSLDFVRAIDKSEKQLIDFALVTFGLFLIYKYLPPVLVRTKSALIAALPTAAAVAILQLSFAGITKTFFQLNKFYGSIATIPLLLTWVLFMWYVILTGAALAASLDKSANAAPHKRESQP